MRGVVVLTLDYNQTMHLDTTLLSYPAISAFCSWCDMRMTRQGALIVSTWHCAYGKDNLG